MGFWDFVERRLADYRAKPKPERHFLEAWPIFLKVVIDPYVLFFVGVSVFLWTAGQKAQAGTMSNGLVQAILAATSGVVGGRIANIFSRETDEGRLIARGKVAVRSLKMAFVHIMSLENRVTAFHRSNEKTASSQEITARNFEEVVRDCRLLQEQMQSAIDNWADIVPGAAGIAASIGAVTAAKAATDEAQANVATLASQLEAANAAGNQKDEKVRQLEGELKEARGELATNKARVRDANNMFLLDAMTSRVRPVSPSKGKSWILGPGTPLVQFEEPSTNVLGDAVWTDPGPTIHVRPISKAAPRTKPAPSSKAKPEAENDGDEE